MKELAEWLKSLEHMAYTLYLESAILFAEDRDLQLFLKQMAADEAEHLRLMETAVVFFADHPLMQGPSRIVLDETTKSEVEKPFKDCLKTIRAGLVSRNYLIRSIIQVEYSELNQIFMYIVNLLRREVPETDTLTNNLDDHLQHIEKYLESVPEFRIHLEEIGRLSKERSRKILIIDNDPPVANLLKAILSKSGQIDTVANGEDGLRKTRENNYHLIISDIDLPVRNGISFYTDATSERPELDGRVLFFSGQFPDSVRDFIEKNNIQYLQKPSSINIIRNKALEIMDAS